MPKFRPRLPRVKLPPAVTFAKWNAGIADTPFIGIADMRNADVYTSPRAIKINFAAEKKSSTTVTALVKWIVRDPVSGNLYGFDEVCRVYTSTDGGGTWSLLTGNVTSGGTGNGLAIWKGYLFAFRNTTADIYGPLASSPVWTTSWNTYTQDTNTSISYSPALVGQNDILYFGAGRYLGSVAEVSGKTFAPGDATTYTFNAQALNIPTNYNIRCLAELGTTLLLGTTFGNDYTKNKVADIFPWDRLSSSFRLPIKVAENGIHQLLTVNTTTYIIAGLEHTIYETNGTIATKMRRLPQHLMNVEGGLYIDPRPGAIMNHKGRLFTGVSSGNTTTTAPMGVWSINLVRDLENPYALTCENLISTGSDGSANAVRIGALFSLSRDEYLIGWQDGSSGTYGIDKISTANRVTTYGTLVKSPFFEVGTKVQKRAFSTLDITLDKALTTGQGVRLSYRTDLSASFTTIVTMDYATMGGAISWHQGFSVPNGCENIQLQAELTTGASSSTSPELLYVMIR